MLLIIDLDLDQEVIQNQEAIKNIIGKFYFL